MKKLVLFFVKTCIDEPEEYDFFCKLAIAHITDREINAVENFRMRTTRFGRVRYSNDEQWHVIRMRMKFGEFRNAGKIYHTF